MSVQYYWEKKRAGTDLDSWSDPIVELSAPDTRATFTCTGWITTLDHEGFNILSRRE